MANKKEHQLKPVDADNETGSAIIYANEVVATIAGIAAAEVEGISEMSNVPSGKIAGKNKNVTKGVKVEVGPEEVSCDLYVIIEYGRPIQKVAQEAQESVRRSLEAMTGLHVVRVDVHVTGVSFEKENNALTAGARNARLGDGKGGSLEKEKKSRQSQSKDAKDAKEMAQPAPEAEKPADQPEGAAEAQPAETAE